ncbi:TlpA family protein disulfide reductase [Pontibacter sp. JH31]|uniref:TlpA family protein disulfide reductase n=1 Tax=Pontibacter aquaedesilientis TaxID=2766980 RepID=A0ABR7XIQ1_9BACT|nr:TlpA disulfide reductase family protein [Pontibacter aquaedesilientis]MBD1398174.1 TlpA family protein disulfide reductase [Pontibacter aquaedesilientis]
MKRILGLALLGLWALTGYSQGKTTDRKSFSGIQPRLVHYRTLVEKAWKDKDEQLALAYSDSVKYSIIGSYTDNHTFVTLDNRQVALGKTIKPVMLVTSATWCGPCMFEIPALNKVAEEYADKVEFVVLFQDMAGEKLANTAKKYGKQILVVPSQKQAEGVSVLSVSGFRHITGFPTNYLINSQNKIINYSQGAFMPMTYLDENGRKVTMTKEEAETRNYEKLKEEAEMLLREHFYKRFDISQ